MPSPRCVGWLLGLGLFSACGDDDAIADAAPDADAVVSDAATLDAASPDAAPFGFGAIEGPCGRLFALLDDAEPSLLTTHLDFATDGYDDATERARLTEGAQEILRDGTAGGSSGVSEAFAFEVLARCEDAMLVKSETEVLYDPPTSKKTDILVEIDGVKVGVSVTRAVGFPREDPYTVDDAAFIERKLDDILASSMNVVPADRWVKQVLLVMAYGEMHAESIRAVWDALGDEVRSDTVLYLVVTDGDDAAIY